MVTPRRFAVHQDVADALPLPQFPAFVHADELAGDAVVLETILIALSNVAEPDLVGRTSECGRVHDRGHEVQAKAKALQGAKSIAEEREKGGLLTRPLERWRPRPCPAQRVAKGVVRLRASDEPPVKRIAGARPAAPFLVLGLVVRMHSVMELLERREREVIRDLERDDPGLLAHRATVAFKMAHQDSMGAAEAFERVTAPRPSASGRAGAQRPPRCSRDDATP
jgi:hypothetical protein